MDMAAIVVDKIDYKLWCDIIMCVTNHLHDILPSGVEVVSRSTGSILICKRHHYRNVSLCSLSFTNDSVVVMDGFNGVDDDSIINYNDPDMFDIMDNTILYHIAKGRSLK